MEHDASAFAAGCDAARADVAAGRLIYRWNGHAGHWGHWVVTHMAERFGVLVDGFGVCLVTASETSFNDGYNSVLIGEIDSHHGSGAFRCLIAEAKAQTEAALADTRQSWLERNGSRGGGA